MARKHSGALDFATINNTMEAPADYADGVYFGDDAVAGQGVDAPPNDAAAAAAVPPIDRQPIFGPVDRSAWLFAKERLSAEQLDGVLADDISDEFETDTTYCYLCHAHNDPTNEVATDLLAMIQSYKQVKPQVLLAVLQKSYNARARRATMKNWNIDQINAHILHHSIDHGIQVADDIRQLNAVADSLGDRLTAKDADGTILPSSRTELRMLSLIHI